MSVAGHAEAAALLRGAYGGEPLEPLRPWIAADDIDGAYAIQKINTDFWVDHGRRIIGRKIGLTAEHVQRQLGVDQPDFGVLFDDMQINEGDVIDQPSLLQPRVEAEIALVLARDLADPQATASLVAASTAYVAAALEIVDSRIRDWRISIADTVADNASSGLFVLGAQWTALDRIDPIGCTMRMRINGETVSTGTGAACLGSPLESAAWLVRTLAQRGEGLRAGDVILTGALGPMAALPPGARVEAEIDGLGLVSCVTRGAQT